MIKRIFMAIAALALLLSACAAPVPDSATVGGGWALDPSAAIDELRTRGFAAVGYRDRPDEKLTCGQAAELCCLAFDLTAGDYLDYILRETGDIAPTDGNISRQRYMWWIAKLGGMGEVGAPYAESFLEQFPDNAEIGGEYRAGVAQLAARQIIFSGEGGSLLPERDITAGEAISILARAVKLQSLEYNNPHDIIITQPEEAYRETTGTHVSILGACDYDYPLYMNGAEISTSPRGFFTQYVELKEGENIFVFTNNGKEESITITKKAPETTEPAEPVVYDEPKYAVVAANHISHMATPGADTNLLTPLAKGTVVKLLGECKSPYEDCYQLEGGTCVYKSSMTVMEETPPEAVITGASIAHSGRFTRVTFDVSVNAFYSIVKNGKSIRLTIHAMEAEDNSLDPADTPITDIVKTVDESAITYDFTFEEDPSGYYVEFRDNKMTVEFRYASKSIEGAKVILDAGHGGEDSGAMGPPGENGPVEADFNLYVAKFAKAYLESRGAIVLLTRGADTRVALADRVSETLSYKPDIFVSVHSNAQPVTKDYTAAKGPLMFYSYDTGREAAEIIYKTVTDRFGFENNGPINDNFAVSRVTVCPTMLFEMSFVCHTGDYEWLLLKDNLDALGEALGMGIEEYLIKDTEDLP